MGAAASEEIGDSQQGSGSEKEELQAEPAPRGGGCASALGSREHYSRGGGAERRGEDSVQNRALEEAVRRQFVAVQASDVKVVEKGRGCISSAAACARKKILEVVTGQAAQVAAVSGLGGAVVAGAGGAGVGFLTCGAAGIAVGLLPALFTCGLSIPCGAVVGATFGTALGAATGSVVGVTGGSAIGYAMYRSRGDIRRFLIAVNIEVGGAGSMQSSLCTFDHARMTVVDNRRQLREVYDVDKKMLGEGASGSVCKASHLETKQERAVKTIAKTERKREEDRTRLEIDILKEMDHPNILKLHETFEDDRNVYLVMEVALGGDLFDCIIDVGRFSERQAAMLMRQILSAVNYLHKSMICHRDLKPENILFMSKEVTIDQSCLKVIDFGLASRFRPGLELTSSVGSPDYVSPQVLQGGYDQLCDMWSVGVILYVLLSGRKPFVGTELADICKEVLRGNFTFELPEWKDVSEDAKNLISWLLRVKPEERYSAELALNHQWVKNLAPAAKEVPLREGVITNLKQFAAQNKLKKAALYVIATQLDEDQIKSLRETFVAMDSDGDGSLSLQEFKDGLFQAEEFRDYLAQAGLEPTMSLLEKIMQGVDTNGDGRISWTEFISAAIEQQNQTRLDVCWQAFHAFDKDGDGKISAAELQEVIADRDVQAVDTWMLLHEIDTSGDNQIDFNEFMAMMRR